MCKSKGPQAGCFVEHSGYGNMDRSSDISKHGCLELLPSNDRHICLEFARASAFNAHQQRSSSVSAASSLANQNPRLASSFKTHNKTILCCLDDMCNYVKTIFDDNTSGGSQPESTSIDQQQSIQRYPTAIIHNNHHRKHNHQQHHPHHHQNNPNLYERSNGIQQHPFPYRTSANEFQLLGRHLQESYDRNDSLSREGSIEFIILFILGLFVLLILLIFCVIRYIKNDVNSNQQKLLMEKYNFQNSTNQRNKFESCYQIEQLDKINMKPSSLANKKSMLGWRHFMSNRHNLAFQKQASSFTKTDSERHRHQSLNKSKMAKKSMKNEQHSTNETCHPLLLSVKVDLNGYQLDPSTKMKILDSDDSDSLFNMKMKRIDTVVNGGAENLPNIISVHNPSNSDNFTQAFRCDYNDLDHPNSMKKNDLLEATDKKQRLVSHLDQFHHQEQ
uniref:Uncharacterized protein n=1 Tax=Sarcoptes scabiei TaxID=52283 RepID=A0A834R6P9_SARSC